MNQTTELLEIKQQRPGFDDFKQDMCNLMLTIRVHEWKIYFNCTSGNRLKWVGQKEQEMNNL